MASRPFRRNLLSLSKICVPLVVSSPSSSSPLSRPSMIHLSTLLTPHPSPSFPYLPVPVLSDVLVSRRVLA
ncbi:hypothetical protein J6590_035717 [Homalodisca vitripennis]|nr:hypothetical protein J6590_035717 [Homalodisca vitripennis]